MNEDQKIVAKAKNKAFRKSLKKMVKELDKLVVNDQAKIVKMLASYCGLVARYE